MSKHTPGPWSWHGVELLSATDFVLESAANGRPSPHNARLISAAPELLEACRRLIGSLHVMVGDGDNDGDIIFARAAIAKATGEAP